MTHGNGAGFSGQGGCPTGAGARPADVAGRKGLLAQMQVAVLGAGTMGRGIAQLLLQAGAHVVLIDPDALVLPRARALLNDTFEMLFAKGRVDSTAVQLLSRLTTSTDVAAVTGSRWVFEAAPEHLELKRSLFEQVEQAAPGARLATNTSTLSVTEIAAGCKNPKNVVGIHFFNPAPLMKLVEVVPGVETPQTLVEDAITVARELGRHPVVAQDRPGFIVNRVARPFYGEALRLAGEGAAFEDIDKSMRAAGFRMGPFELLDLIGLDVNLAATTGVFNAFYGEAHYRPHPLQSSLVNSGRLGAKTGRGFYSYDANGRRVQEAEPMQAVQSTHSNLRLGRNPTAVVNPPVRQAGQATGAADLANLRVCILGTNAVARLLSNHLNQAAPGALVAEADAGTDMQGALDLLIDTRVTLNEKVPASNMPATRHYLGLCWAHSASALASVLKLAPVTPAGFSILPGPQALSGNSAAGDALAIELLQPVTEQPGQLQPLARLLESVGLTVISPPDQAGGNAFRIFALLVNEAVSAVAERLASHTDIDLAMRLGVNYPAGPLEWAETLGLRSIYTALKGLHAETAAERFGPHPLLTKLVAAGGTGFSDLKSFGAGNR